MPIAHDGFSSSLCLPEGIRSFWCCKSTRMRVRFPKGTWNFRVSQLRPLRFQPGDYVQWKKHDEDIPEGDCRNPLGFSHEIWMCPANTYFNQSIEL